MSMHPDDLQRLTAAALKQAEQLVVEHTTRRYGGRVVGPSLVPAIAAALLIAAGMRLENGPAA